MNRETFIEKWFGQIGREKYIELLADFYSVLTNEREETMKTVNETLDKLK